MMLAIHQFCLLMLYQLAFFQYVIFVGATNQAHNIMYELQHDISLLKIIVKSDVWNEKSHQRPTISSLLKQTSGAFQTTMTKVQNDRRVVEVVAAFKRNRTLRNRRSNGTALLDSRFRNLPLRNLSWSLARTEPRRLGPLCSRLVGEKRQNGESVAARSTNTGRLCVARPLFIHLIIKQGRARAVHRRIRFQLCHNCSNGPTLLWCHLTVANGSLSWSNGFYVCCRCGLLHFSMVFRARSYPFLRVTRHCKCVFVSTQKRRFCENVVYAAFTFGNLSVPAKLRRLA
jgi:hypothetical protein